MSVPVYYDNIREYLIKSHLRTGVKYVKDVAVSEPPVVIPPPPVSDTDVRAKLIERLRTYFAEGDRFEHLKCFLAKQAAAEEKPAAPPVSLRILEFLCTDNGLSLPDDPAADRNLTDDYQHMLKAHSKAYFDIFARGERFDFQVDGGGSVKTTVGQLQFFKWAIERGLLERVQKEKETLRREAKERNDLRNSLRPVREKTKRPLIPNRVRKNQLVARVCFDGPFTVRLGMQ